jgi:hypothetical protein
MYSLSELPWIRRRPAALSSSHKLCATFAWNSLIEPLCTSMMSPAQNGGVLVSETGMSSVAVRVEATKQRERM